ncbi:MAG: hypothetical protein H7A36_06495 [Chlamydiales bacterium]|nr:hypothetical protein [Chlamydiales bacterium]
MKKLTAILCVCSLFTASAWAQTPNIDGTTSDGYDVSRGSSGSEVQRYDTPRQVEVDGTTHEVRLRMSGESAEAMRESLLTALDRGQAVWIMGGILIIGSGIVYALNREVNRGGLHSH